MMTLWSLLPDEMREKIESNLYHETVENMTKLALENGFTEVSTKKKQFKRQFESLDQFLIWVASSSHTFDYQHLLQTLKEICDTKDISFLYNEKGQAEYRAILCIYECKL